MTLRKHCSSLCMLHFTGMCRASHFENCMECVLNDKFDTIENWWFKIRTKVVSYNYLSLKAPLRNTKIPSNLRYISPKVVSIGRF